MTKIKTCGLFRERDIDYVNQYLPPQPVARNGRGLDPPAESRHSGRWRSR